VRPARSSPAPRSPSASANRSVHPDRSQETALAAIERDLDREVPWRRSSSAMWASGKTVLALAARFARGAGMQTAILAPTTLLAEQHRKRRGGFWARPGFGSRS